MKKRLLFVIESMNLGGAEKSLATLLNLIDYSKYEVDLQLFSYGGPFEKLLTKEVNILPILPFFQYCNIPYSNVISKITNVNYLISQISFSFKLRSGKYTNTEKAVIMWESIKSSIQYKPKEYDVAIAYAQGGPTFYVADKVIAKKKIAWINVTYLPQGKYFEYIDSYYTKYDYVNCVSESVEKQVKETFNNVHDKIIVIKDILSFEFNKKMSTMERINFENKTKWNILTVGRLVNQKGYDLAVEACKLLKEKNIDFKWYVIGEGNQRQMIESKIKEYNLEDTFILLGAKANPYPYFNNCDIYVQTSRFEGFGITLAEARMFNKPVVTTEFDAVYSQMIPDVNGMVVKITPEAIADGIIKMMNDHDYRNNIIHYLKTEKKSNLEELDKFYEVIEK